MADDLTIYFHPLGGETGSEVERASYAEIGVAVGGQWLTLLEDRFASTVSNYLRGSVHQLATWFAGNWWRLRWEPDTRDWSTNVDWRMAHSVAGAGGGFVWPNVLFASDGETLAVASRPRGVSAAFEPVRYLNRFDGRIAASQFENKVDLFVESVISRLHGVGIRYDSLSNLWNELTTERNDPEAAHWRKLEAMAGYDPDEAPKELMERLLDDQEYLGNSAIEEVAAEARHGINEAMLPIREVSRARKPKEGGYRLTVPILNDSVVDDGILPWQNASRLASLARKEWDLGDKPIRNKQLAALLDTAPDVFSDDSAPRSKMPFAVRQGQKGKMDVYLHSPFSANRRFALGRIIGDHLGFAAGEKLLPATQTRTVRQKFQRAFAQEFLCPYRALVDRLQTEHPDDDEIAAAAKYFHVSQLVVKTTLVNKGELERTALPTNSQYLAVAA